MQPVEGVAGIAQPVLGRVAGRGPELHVVGVEGVGDDDDGPGRSGVAERLVTGVVVHVVLEAVLDEQAARVLGGEVARQPAERARAARAIDRGHCAGDELPLCRLVHAVLVDPAVAVGADLVAAIDDLTGERGRALQREGGAGEGGLHPVLAQQREDAGRAAENAVAVVGLVRVVPPPAQAHPELVHRLRPRVPVEHPDLRPLLDVHHDGQREPRSVRPGLTHRHAPARSSPSSPPRRSAPTLARGAGEAFGGH